MGIVTFVNFLAIFICFCGRLLHREKVLFLIVTIILILFYSIRTEYGNDLPAYIYNFEKLSFYSFETFSLIDKEWEPGWLCLNLLFAPFGWQWFLFFLTTIQFATIYWVITRYCNNTDCWIIFSIYILSSNLFLSDLSMLRQALAMHICVWSIPSILNRKIVKAIIIIYAATTIHTSAYVAFLLIIFPYISKCNKCTLILIFFSIFLLLKTVSSLFGDLLLIVLSFDTFEKYEGYIGEKSQAGLELWVIFQALTCVWMLYKSPSDKTNLFFIISQCIYVLILPLYSIAPLITRTGMYFNLIGIVSFKNLCGVKRDAIGFSMLIITLIMSIRSYFDFFESPTWRDSFAVYHTIFD